MSSAQLKKFALVKPAEIEWRDGLPFSLEFDDIYFSRHGAVEESTHVFIEGNQLPDDWNANPEKDFTIAELGFGSGLNFLNTVSHWLNHQSKTKSTLAKVNPQHLNYVAIEKRPFTKNDLIKVSKLWPQFQNISQQLLLNYPSQTYGRHQISFKDWNVSLTLMWMPIEDAFIDLIQECSAQENKIKFDHWFLDGFSPQKNTSMWDEKNAFQIAQLSKVGTRLATYSVAEAVKRPLIEAGFKIIKRKGFAKKREMLTSMLQDKHVDENESKFINIKHETPWFNIINVKPTRNPKVAIIGAGIAGCATAYCLSNKGFSCDIYESKPEIAGGASGASAGVFHPQLSSDMNFGSQFSWLSYLTLLRFLSSLTVKEKAKIIISEGVHRFLENEGSKRKLIELSKNLKLSHWIKENDNNSKINSSVYSTENERSIYFPDSAVLDMPALCQLYLDKIKNDFANVYVNSKVTSFTREGNVWQVNSNFGRKSYTHIVFCGGAKSHLLNDFNVTAVNTTRGQTCQFESPALAKIIKQTLSDQIYLVPQTKKGNNQFQLGATFENDKDKIFEDGKLNPESQKTLLNRTSKLFHELSIPCLTEKQMAQFPLKGSVGYRLQSNDRLPMVGAMIDQHKLIKDFSSFGQKRLLRNSMSNYNQPGIWLNTAYGSHGLMHSLLASNHLASLISSSISPLDFTLSNHLHPARFLIKQLNRATP